MIRHMIAAVLAMVLSAMFLTSTYAESGSDVFMDEGEADFGDLPEDDPAPAPAPEKSAPAPAPEKTAPAASEPPPMPESGPDIFSETPPADEDSAPALPADEPAKPAPKAKPAKKAKAKKAATGGGSGKGFFKTVQAECVMRAQPAEDSAKLITVKPGKKLWLEDVDGEWFKGFRKGGEEGFLNKNCF